MHDILLGLVMGLASGVAPGPLQTVVLSQAARFGWRAGAAAAFAPLITDAVIVAITLGLVGILPGYALHLISAAGALLVAYIAQDSWRSLRHQEEVPTVLAAAAGHDTPTGSPAVAPAAKTSSLMRASLVNILNPHAWLFWAIVGAPIAVRLSSRGFIYGAFFVAAFYVAMVGSKILQALLVGRGVQWLGSNFQKWVIRASAIGLMIVAVLLFLNGVHGLIAH